MLIVTSPGRILRGAVKTGRQGGPPWRKTRPAAVRPGAAIRAAAVGLPPAPADRSARGEC